MTDLTPERARAFRVIEWADLNGDDVPGALRLDEEADAETLAIIYDALLAAGDAYYSLAAIDAERARAEAAEARVADLEAVAEVARAYDQHFRLNLGCHTGCPEHEELRDALARLDGDADG